MNLLVIVDQFEELFRYQTRHQEAAAFVNLLLGAKSQTSFPIFIAITMRSDFLGECAQFPGLPEAINEGQYLVPRLTREQRRAAIAGPVAVGGAAISPVLLTRLVNDVGDNPDQLSILQHALNRTWAEWRSSGGTGPLDLPHYEAIGTMAHALDRHAEDAYEELKTERRKQICEKIFKALTDRDGPIFMTVPTALPSPRAVNLTAADGTKLKASYFSAGKPGPGVLLLHQCGEQRNNWDELTTRLAAAGINVLTLDYRGHGESGGTAIKELPEPDFARLMREKWPGDIDVAFAYLVAQPGVVRGTVGAGGASCGVFHAIRLARRHAEVKSLVLLSCPILFHGDREFSRTAKDLPMLICAADDGGGTPAVMQWLYELSTNPGSKFLHYQTGGHGVEMFVAHKELPGMIVDWYVQTLLRTPGRAPAARANGMATRPPDILELIDSPGGAAKVDEQLAEARKKNPKANLFSDVLVNMLGYTHIQDGDYKGAIDIMKLNVAANPNSPGVYDSLADAYLADGQTDLARQSATKTLQLLVSDSVDDEPARKALREGAEAKLKQLGEKP